MCQLRGISLAHPIKKFLESHRKTKLSKISELIPAIVSTRTLQKRIQDLCYNTCVAVKKAFVNDIQKKKRLEFANSHLTWTTTNWAKVIWSDESSFEIGKLSKEVHVWRTPK